MTEEDTQMTIDRSQVSQETVQELIEKGAIDESEKDNFEDRSQLQQITPEATPNKTPVTHKLKSVLRTAHSSLNGLLQNQLKESAYSTIEAVKIDDEENIGLELTNPKLDTTTTYWIAKDSVAFANLLEYYEITDPRELEGKTLIKKPNSGSSPTHYIPENVSFNGKLQYKLYGKLTDIQGKTDLEGKSDSVVPLEISLLLGIIALGLSLEPFGVLSQALLGIGTILVTPCIVIICLVIISILLKVIIHLYPHNPEILNRT